MDTSLVTVLKIYPGLTPHLLTTLLSTPGLRGIILETFGAGNIPLSLIPPLRTAIQTHNLVILNITQCLHGSVSPSYEPARKLVEAGIQLGHDMTTEAAYTKMVYLWSLPGATRESVEEGIGRNVQGELTPPEILGTGQAGGPFSIAQLPIRYERTVPGRLDLGMYSQQSRL